LRFSGHLFLALAALLAAIPASPPATAQTTLVFALPTAADHPRNRAVARWAARVAKASGGALRIAVRSDATDYTGIRMLSAVAEGAVDMAAPGWWHVARFAPDFRLPALPMFYGRERALFYSVFDGAAGRELDARLEKALGVVVLGRRLDLGFGQIYLSARAVKTYEDLKGLNIRVPGGGADLARYLVFGATPRRVAPADLKDAFRRKLFGGLLTTHLFVRDAALWEVGVRFAFLDNQVFYQYTPIVNRVRWAALPQQSRDLLAQSWEALVDDSRRIVAERQAAARAEAARQGVAYVEATPDQRAAMRTRLMAEQPAIVKALEMDADFIARVQALLPTAK